MNIELLTKVFTFTEAKQILAQQIKEFAGRPAPASNAKSPIKRFELRIENMDLLSWLSQLNCPVVNRPTPLCLSGPNRRPEQWTYGRPSSVFQSNRYARLPEGHSARSQSDDFG